MTEGFSEQILSQISELVAARIGLHFPRERWNALESGLRKASSALGFGDVLSLAWWLLETPSDETRVEALASYLTIGETHFFRDEKLFRALEEHLLPQLRAVRDKQGRSLRFWSAGCATGEEPYSIAIVLSKTIPQIRDWFVAVLATDINRTFLEKASEGIYSQWSFRVVPEGVREYYFARNGDGYRINDDIKKMVTFNYLNLAIDEYPHSSNNTEAMDVIFCRNVLMYFTPELQKTVVDRLFRSLTDDGLLVVSPAEASIVDHPQLISENIPGTVLFRKTDKPKPVFSGFSIAMRDAIPEASGVALIDSMPSTLSTVSDEPCYKAFQPFTEDPPENSDVLAIAPEEDPYQEALGLYNRGDYCGVIARLAVRSGTCTYRCDDAGCTALLLSRAYANKGDLIEALEWSQRAVGEDKLNPESHYLHGTILHEMGRMEEAMLAMNRAVFLDPDLVVAHFALGNMYQRHGKLKERDRHYRIARNLLSRYSSEDTVPASEGIPAGRFSELIEAMSRKES